MKKNPIHHGTSVISLEILSDYPDPVITKRISAKHISNDNLQALENEFEMTNTLKDIEGVRQALDKKSINNQEVLILEYIEGNTLLDYIREEEYDLRTRLEVAVKLTAILEKIHRQKIIHLNLESKNIIIGDEGHRVYLIDFDSACRLDTTNHLQVNYNQTLKNLQYISPEQTGRINRVVDERSDNYSLGVILYELFTGRVPFDSIDPMELIHSHVSKTPKYRI